MSKSRDAIYDPQQFRAWGHQIIDLLADHLEESIGGQRAQTLPWKPPDEELAFWQQLDAQEIGPIALFEQLLSRSISLHDPRFIGHQVSAPAPVGALFGLLGKYLNNGTAVYEMGMASNCLEKLLTDQLCRRFGFGPEAGGILTHGGTLANLTALLSARQAKGGSCGGRRPALMVSDQAHYSIERAALIMGWPADAVLQVPVDDGYCMETGQLEVLYQEAYAAGWQVLAVVGLACSTSTGSYDDLEAIGAFCKRRGLWFHVDGAHGGAAIFSDTYRPLLRGIDAADSIALDFHKMLLTPALATALLYKDNHHSFRTFAQHADYLLDQERDWHNSGKRTFECTKSMLSATLYGIVKTHGWESLGAHVDALYRRARECASWLEQQPHFELACPVQANILCFRCVEPGLSAPQTDALNAFVRQKLVEEGAYYIVQTRLRGALYLRLSVMNPYTTLEHVQALAAKLLDLVASWRPPPAQA